MSPPLITQISLVSGPASSNRSRESNQGHLRWQPDVLCSIPQRVLSLQLIKMSPTKRFTYLQHKNCTQNSTAVNSSTGLYEDASRNGEKEINRGNSEVTMWQQRIRVTCATLCQTRRKFCKAWPAGNTYKVIFYEQHGIA